jgi:putative transposase
MPDHLHLAVSIPPKIAVADFIGQIKGSSSFRINKQDANAEQRGFRWQTEYGALTFGERSLATVVAYVENQATHHASHTLWPSFERLDIRPLASSLNAHP